MSCCCVIVCFQERGSYTVLCWCVMPLEGELHVFLSVRVARAEGVTGCCVGVKKELQGVVLV